MPSDVLKDYLDTDSVTLINTLANQGLAQTMRSLLTPAKNIPHPAKGQTLLRWKILAQVAAVDLSLAKWFESHLDALSILHELNVTNVPDGLWAVWAADGGPAPLKYAQGQCSGIKPWCSGANSMDYGLVTYRDAEDAARLLMINLHQPGIEIDESQWHAIGMAHTATATVQLSNVPAVAIGEANAYLKRSGFWHGAAGVAACWYGATVGIAEYLLTASEQKPHYYKSFYLGEISTQLFATRLSFEALAHCIDVNPQQSHEYQVRILRAQVEQTARLVIDRVGQALGAAPFCQSKQFAQMLTDLPVFIRQTHGAFDWEQIGKLAATQEPRWAL